MKYAIYGVLAGGFTWVMTIIGSMFVFGIKTTKNKLISLLLGLGGGIMLAASIFSLIIPAIEYCDSLEKTPWMICTLGFILGILMIVSLDMFLSKREQKNNIEKSNLLFVLAIIFHNIPEGLAIGVAFGSIPLGIENVTISSAILLAVGIGLQNLPEGAAISIPLNVKGMNKRKAFLIGAFSAIVEPISAFLGALLVIAVKNILPLMLLMASSAMIYVIVDEIIPTSRTYHQKFTTLGMMLGFIVMMILDLAFG